jgi:hypothetical protein
MTMSFFTAVPQVSFSNAFLLKKVRPYFLIFMRGFVNHDSSKSMVEKLSGKAFTS